MSFREFLQESKVDLVVKTADKTNYEIVKINNRELKQSYQVGDKIEKSKVTTGTDGSLGFDGYNVEVK